MSEDQNHPPKKKSRTRKWAIALGIFAGILLLTHLLAPVFIKKYVNRTLDELDGYTGRVESVGLNLFRGAYTINGIQIDQEEAMDSIPFFACETIDLSVEWKALWHGKIVGEIDFIHPVVNFVGAKDSEEVPTQYGAETDWTQPLKDLIPLTINRLAVERGEVHYKDPTSQPTVDVDLRNIALVAENLTNAENNSDTLPSAVKLTATSLGNGQLDLSGRMNVLSQDPDFDLKLIFENANLTAFNEFLRAYANLDVEAGKLSVYSELAAANGEITGYVKPIVDDLDIFEWKKDKESLGSILWEGLAGTVSKIFTNPSKKQFATRVPIRGNLNTPDALILPTVFSVFKNAFIMAFEKKIEGSVNLKLQLSEKD